MSELKVNSIAPLTTTGIRFNSPVGINTNAPTSGLQISGKLNVIDNNIEVVTVGAQNYGIKIKAAPSTGDSVLQFANYDGSERAHIKSSVLGDLIFNTGGATAAVMGSDGVFNMLQKTIFNRPVTVNATSRFNNQANFLSNFIPKCSGVPTVDDHLVNFAYLKRFVLGTNTIKTWQVFGNIDNGGRGGCCRYFNGSTSTGSYYEGLPGKWVVIGFNFGARSCSCRDNETFHFPIDNSAVWMQTDSSVRQKIAQYLGTNIYSAFGMAIRVDIGEA
jgi:hypothetical protein